jgi:hypothetical protein
MPSAGRHDMCHVHADSSFTHFGRWQWCSQFRPGHGESSGRYRTVVFAVMTRA